MTHYTVRLVVLLSCMATSALAGDSGPQRAAAMLGLREHQPVPLPDWLGQAPSIWVKTTRADCASFSNRWSAAPVLLEHTLCRVTRRDGAVVTDYVEIELLTAPEPPSPDTPLSTHGPRTVSQGGPLLEFDANISRQVSKGTWFSGSGSSGRLGPWYAVSSHEGAVRFESMVRAWLPPVWEVRECTPESLEALGAVALQREFPEGRQRCPADGMPATERDVDFDGIKDYFPPDRIVPEPADCRIPCPGRLPQGTSALYRDPKPEVVQLFRTKDLCQASDEPGLFPMPKSDCGGD